MENESDKRKLWREQKQQYRKNRKEYSLILSSEQSIEAENLATEKGMTVPELLRALIESARTNNKYIVPKTDDIQLLILEIRKIGVNINQIAKYVNGNKTVNPFDITRLKERLVHLETLVIQRLTNPPKNDI